MSEVAWRIIGRVPPDVEREYMLMKERAEKEWPELSAIVGSAILALLQKGSG